MSANMFGYAAGGVVLRLPRLGAQQGADVRGRADRAGRRLRRRHDRLHGPPGERAAADRARRRPASPEYFVSTEQFLNALSDLQVPRRLGQGLDLDVHGPDDAARAERAGRTRRVPNASTPANAADVLAIRAMVQTQYSNIGGAESLWVDHTVQPRRVSRSRTADATNASNATVRWYQANVTGGTVAANVVQGETFDPDGANTFFRFMPSLAVDRIGDMAIGYTKSNATTNPQIKYAGRLAGDPVNTFSQTEQTLIDGTGAQSGNCGGSACTRWGDYSGMALDPNGCTFWMTGEYYADDRPERPDPDRLVPLPGLHAGRQRHALGHGHRRRRTRSPARPSRSAAGRRRRMAAAATRSPSRPGRIRSLTASKAGLRPGLGLDDRGSGRRHARRGTSRSARRRRAAASPTTRRAPSSAACRRTATSSRARAASMLANPDNTDAQNTTVSPTRLRLHQHDLGRPDVHADGHRAAQAGRRRALLRGVHGEQPEHHALDPGHDRARRRCRPAPTSRRRRSPGFNDGGAGGLKTFTFASPVTLTAGTRYAFVFRLACCVRAAGRTPTPAAARRRASRTRTRTRAASASPRRTAARPGRRTRRSAAATSTSSRTSTPASPPSGTFVSSLKDANPAAGRTPTLDDALLHGDDARRHGRQVPGRGEQQRARSVQLRRARRHGGDVLHHERRQPEPVQRLPLPASTRRSCRPRTARSRRRSRACRSASPTSRRRARRALAVDPATGTFGGTTTLVGDADVRRERRERQDGRLHAQRDAASAAPPRTRSGVATLGSVSLAGHQRRLVPDRSRRLVRRRRQLRPEQRLELADREQGRPGDHRHHARAGERRLQHELQRRRDRRRLGQRGHLLELAAPARTSAPRSR